MLFKTFFPVALLLSGTQATPTVNHQKRQSSLDTFIKAQADISIKGVLANIGTDGSKAKGVPAGIVVASPSRTNPDCKYISLPCRFPVSTIT